MGKKRVKVQLTYTADFDEDFDMSLLQNIDTLIGFGLVGLLRKKSKQVVDVLPGASINLWFPQPARAKRRKSARP